MSKPAPTGITFWHGAKRWDGPPTIYPPRAGKYECGPGIYCTTHYDTARKYTKGGGMLMRFHLADDIRWLEFAKLPVETMIEFLRSVPRLPRRDDIIKDLRESAEHKKKNLRHGESSDLPVSYLVNLGVNYESFAGKPGVILAEWLASHGIDASMHNSRNDEQWIIIFNPDKIVRWEPVRAKEADAMGWPNFDHYQAQVVFQSLCKSNYGKSSESVEPSTTKKQNKP